MSSGGKRVGAGRPRLENEQSRKVVSFRVSPETAERIKALRERGYQVGRLFDDFIAAVFRDSKK